MNWESVKLGSLGEFRNGLNYSKEDEGEGLKVISVKNFGDLRVPNYDELDEINPDGVNTKYSRLEAGDIIFVRSNGNKDLIGRSMYVEETMPDVSYSGFCIRFRNHSPKVRSKFLAYYFRSPLFRRTLSNLGGGTNINNLNQTVLKNFEISVPNPAEQEKILATISSYDDLIENNRRRIALLEEAARLLYREWFVHFRFPGHEHVKVIDGVPENFQRLELGSFCQLRGGNAFKTKYQGQRSGEYPFIKVRDMNSTGNSISITEADNWVSEVEAKEMKAKPFNPGAIFFAKIGEALKQNRVRISVKDTIIDNNMMGAIPDEDIVSSAFLYFLLSDYDIASHASGAAVPFLSASVLSRIKFSIPNKALSVNFDDSVEPILQQITNLQAQITTAAKARDLLLPRLMDGRLEV